MWIHRTRVTRTDAAEPPTLHTAVPNWSPGDTIPLGAGRTLRVIDVRPGEDADVLVVETT
jgi:hypothetical protein